MQNPALAPYRNGMTDFYLQNQYVKAGLPGPGATLAVPVVAPVIADAGYLQNQVINPAQEPWRNGSTDFYLQNQAANPALEPWRNGMTDFYLQNQVINPAMEPWRNGMTDFYLQNQVPQFRSGLEPWANGYLQNQAANPALEPWRNGMTDFY